MDGMVGGGGADPFDVGLVGRALLDAAHGARIGVTVTVIEGASPRTVYLGAGRGGRTAQVGRSPSFLSCNPMDIVASSRSAPHARPACPKNPRGEGRAFVRADGLAERRHRGLPRSHRNPRDGDGPDGIIVGTFVVDATHRMRKAERGTAARNEARFRELIEIAPEPIGIVRNGKFVYVNAAYDQRRSQDTTIRPTFRYRSGSLDRFLDQRTSRPSSERDAASRRDNKSRPSHVFRARRRDGSMVNFLEVSSVCTSKSKASRQMVLTMARDITGTKETRGAAGASPTGSPPWALWPLASRTRSTIHSPM